MEIIDDVRELSQAAGEMRRITVIEATRRIQFTPALPTAMLPRNFPDSLFPRVRHLRVRRWDQKGQIFRTDRNGRPVQVQDLDATGSTGVIAVPRGGTTLLLENGVTVSFASTGAKGFRAGDYWVFAARTADTSVETLDGAPPRGIDHHYARLGLLDVAAGTVMDCRNPWPPRGGHDSSTGDKLALGSAIAGGAIAAALIETLFDKGTRSPLRRPERSSSTPCAMLASTIRPTALAKPSTSSLD